MATIMTTDSFAKRPSRLPQDLLDKLIPLLEANYHYNCTLLEFYDSSDFEAEKVDFNLQNFGVAASHPGLNEAIKKDALKEKLFLEGYMTRFKNEDNQQKILDDLFEEHRFSLHTLRESFKIAKTNTYTQQKLTEPLEEIYNLIAPYISSFAKDFIRYNPLSYNQQSRQAGYVMKHNEFGLRAYKTYIDSELTKLSKLGLEDIDLRKQKIAELDGQYFFHILFEMAAERSTAVLNKEAFYALYCVLEDAKCAYQEKLRSAAKKVDAPSLVSNPILAQAPAQETVKALVIETPEKTTKVVQAASAVSSDELKVKADDLAKSFSATSISTASNLGVDTAPKPGLNFAQKKHAKHQQRKAKEREEEDLKKKSETTILDDKPTISAKIIKNLEKYKEDLVALFYAKGLKKVQIKENTLESILASAGGKINNREGTRRQLSFKGRLGFVSNKNTTEEAHFHTKNQAYAGPEILAHYRDFFHRIGIAPYQLWPRREHPPLEHRATKTSRVHGAKP